MTEHEKYVDMLRFIVEQAYNSATNRETMYDNLKKSIEKMEPKKFWEVSLVKCDLCGKSWTAVRPEGLERLQCPQRWNTTTFENLGT